MLARSEFDRSADGRLLGFGRLCRRQCLDSILDYNRFHMIESQPGFLKKNPDWNGQNTTSLHHRPMALQAPLCRSGAAKSRAALRWYEEREQSEQGERGKPGIFAGCLFPCRPSVHY